MKRTRILLVDDQVLFVQSLQTVLRTDAHDMEVVGVAANGREAAKLADELLPDIVLMDVRMPVMDGVEATRIIKERHPDMIVLTLTTFDDDLYVEKTLQYGAAGYLLKNIPPAELIASIRAARGGAVLMDSSIAARLVRKAYQGATDESDGAAPEAGPTGIESLSQREREVLRLLARGLGNRQICERLSIADSTVRNHITMIYSKLDVHDRYTAMQIAIRAGIV